jgi:hypothetical protein
MERRRQSSSGFGRLDPAAAELIPDALKPIPKNWWTRLERKPVAAAIGKTDRPASGTST